MRSRVAAGLSLLLACALAQAQGMPRAGKWEISMTLSGVPRGGGTTTAQACLSLSALSPNPEQGLLDAAPAGADGVQAKCTVSELKRDGSRSNWAGSCVGPMGAMPSIGAGLIEPDRVDIQQSMEASTPIGKRKIQQRLQAQRLGEC